MTGRGRVLVWTGSGFAVTGLAVALVAWVGLDRANQDLGVPAAVAAFLGLAVSVVGLLGDSRTAREHASGTVKQQADAKGKARVVQIGGTYGSGGGDATGIRPPAKVTQRAKASKAADITQIGGGSSAPDGGRPLGR